MTWRNAVFGTVLLMSVPAAGKLTEESFQLRTGGDLVALCSAAADDPLYVAALHMCHGFGSGAYQAIRALTQHEKLEPLFCPPDPPPTRNQALAAFVEWANANPQYLSDQPVQLLGRFLITNYPCATKVTGGEAK